MGQLKKYETQMNRLPLGGKRIRNVVSLLNTLKNNEIIMRRKLHDMVQLVISCLFSRNANDSQSLSTLLPQNFPYKQVSCHLQLTRWVIAVSAVRRISPYFSNNGGTIEATKKHVQSSHH